MFFHLKWQTSNTSNNRLLISNKSFITILICCICYMLEFILTNKPPFKLIITRNIAMNEIMYLAKWGHLNVIRQNQTQNYQETYYSAHISVYVPYYYLSDRTCKIYVNIFKSIWHIFINTCYEELGFSFGLSHAILKSKWFLSNLFGDTKQ